MNRERLPFEEALALIGLTGGFVGDDPQRPSHLRLRVADRAVIWPLEDEHRGLIAELRRAVADMVANTALLSRSGHDLEIWAEAVQLDARLAATQAAFEMALALDGFAEQLLTRRVLDGLLDGTDWRNYLQRGHLPGLIHT